MLGYGAFLTSVVQFLLMAFTVFWMIKVVTTLRVKLESEAVAKLSKLSSVLPGGKKEEEVKEAPKEEKPAEPAPAPAPEPAPAVSAETTELLREIRDLLKASKSA